MDENMIGKHVVDAALRVHRELGPGLFETVYELVLAHELEQRGLSVERQVPVPIIYKGQRFEAAFRADLIVQRKVILELKSLEQMSKVHPKQVFTYLKLTGLKLGFVLNFGAGLMKDGIERVVNGLPDAGERPRQDAKKEKLTPSSQDAKIEEGQSETPESEKRGEADHDQS